VLVISLSDCWRMELSSLFLSVFLIPSSLSLSLSLHVAFPSLLLVEQELLVMVGESRGSNLWCKCYVVHEDMKDVRNVKRKEFKIKSSLLLKILKLTYYFYRYFLIEENKKGKEIKEYNKRWKNCHSKLLFNYSIK